MKIIAVLFSIITFYVFPQQVTTFHDQFGKQGTVNHQGEWNDSILPKKGRFDLKWRSTVNNDSLITYLAKGRLKDHRPTGLWTWEEAGWDYTVEIGTSILPEFNTYGLHSIWKGSFNDGLPHGKWIYGQGPPVLRPEKSTTPLKIEAEYKNGVLSGAFKIIDKRTEKEVVISGSTDDKGIATGVWRFNYFSDTHQHLKTETRVYVHGILTTRMLNNDTIVFHDAISNLKRIEAGDTSVVIGDERFLSDDVISTGVELLSEYMNEYFLEGWELEVFPYDIVRHPPIYKRFAYPLNNSELSKRKKVASTVEKMQAQVKSHLSKGNVYINRSRSKELDIAISALEAATSRLELMDSLISFSKTTDFLYLDRKNGGLIDWATELEKTSNFKGVAYPDQKARFKKLDLDQQEWFIFELSLSLLEDLKLQLPSYYAQVDESFEALNREGELKALENKMVAELKMLDSLYKEKKNFGDYVHAYWVDTYLSEQIKTYANTDAYEKALELGNSLIRKMGYLLDWHQEWDMLSSIQNDLSESYTNYAYNPYNGEHDIELPVKKRFIQNVKAKMIPWKIEQLENAKEWDEFKKQWLEFKEMRVNLIAFAQMNDRPDRRIERKLRREDDPSRMYRLFSSHMSKYNAN